jgi:multicomponent Na+:H+ antiporter subunit G
MSALGCALAIAGAVLLVVAAWGVLILPDALARQHAATKAGTFALALVCAGAALLAGDGAWTWRLGLIAGFLLATLPVASHMLARAAARESGWAAAMDGARDVPPGGTSETPPARR